jgi:hypothetical protein
MRHDVLQEKKWRLHGAFPHIRLSADEQGMEWKFRMAHLESVSRVLRIVDMKTKKEIRKTLDRMERGITRSIIRWKYKKEDRPLPQDEFIEDQSRSVVNEAHRIVSKRGKRIWNELRKVYSKESREEEDKNS